MKKVPAPEVAAATDGPEGPLPPQIQEALDEFVGAAKKRLLAISAGVGLSVVHELMEFEVDQVVGLKRKHDPKRGRRSATATRRAR